MTLKDKYGIPNSTWQAMVRDGIITCKIMRAEDIVSCYRKKIDSGVAHTEAVATTADDMHCSSTWVYEILRKYK